MSPTGDAHKLEKRLLAEGFQPHDDPDDRETWEGTECEKCARPVLWRGYIKAGKYRALIYCSAGHVQEV